MGGVTINAMIPPPEKQENWRNNSIFSLWLSLACHTTLPPSAIFIYGRNSKSSMILCHSELCFIWKDYRQEAVTGSEVIERAFRSESTCCGGVVLPPAGGDHGVRLPVAATAADLWPLTHCMLTWPADERSGCDGVLQLSGRRERARNCAYPGNRLLHATRQLQHTRRDLQDNRTHRDISLIHTHIYIWVVNLMC